MVKPILGWTKNMGCPKELEGDWFGFNDLLSAWRKGVKASPDSFEVVMWSALKRDL